MAEKKNSYVVLATKKYDVVVEVVKNKETDKEYLNMTLNLNGKSVALSLRNYDSFVADTIKEEVKRK